LVLLLSSSALISAAGADAKKQSPVQFSGLDLQSESLKKQRESLSHQLGVKPEISRIDFELVPPVTTLIESDCPSLPTGDVDSLITAAARKQALSSELLRAVMRQESGFKPCAVSIKGAEGLMQLMPATAWELHVVDPFDPKQNVQGGAAYLKQLLKRYNGDLRLALVAYNAGPARADQLDPSEYPLETQQYLANILAELGEQEGPGN